MYAILHRFIAGLPLFAVAASLSAAVSATDAELRALAARFPEMPRGTGDMARFTGSPTFSSGTPFNDLQYTLLDTDYIDGENGGFDTFMPVDPAHPNPGSNKVKYIRCALNTDLDNIYGAASGDRIILGTKETASSSAPPFFLIGSDGIDNDYAVIQHFDYENGRIQLSGNPAHYRLILGTVDDGCATSGYYLFYLGGNQPDLIAFVYPATDIEPAVNGAEPRNSEPYGPANSVLSLSNPAQFVFATAPSTTVKISTTGGAVGQYGTAGKEIVGGFAVDSTGNYYLVGNTDGAAKSATEKHENALFVRKVKPDRTVAWTKYVPMTEGSLLMGAVADSTHLYVCGRTLGALSGYTNAGRWDGIMLKLELSDGDIVRTHQWGNAGIDGYGNIALDGNGGLFVSGQGSPASGFGGTDKAYLVAKHRTSDLDVVWRRVDEISGAVGSAEAWGGLTFVPSGSVAGEGKLIVAGWYATTTDADAFVAVYNNLTRSAPSLHKFETIKSTVGKAEWILDSAVDSKGRVYLAGYTTGSLVTNGAKGQGDAFLLRLNADLTGPVYRQFGTANSDAATSLEIDASGNVHVLGYTYGSFGTRLKNADATGRSGDIFLRTYKPDLTLLGDKQWGTEREDRGILKMSGATRVIGGMTEGAFTGARLGSFDAVVYIVK